MSTPATGVRVCEHDHGGHHRALRRASRPWRRSPRRCFTATPLQSSLLELYGLVSIIDDYAFGDLKSYRARFVRPSRADDFSGLGLRVCILWDTLSM